MEYNVGDVLLKNYSMKVLCNVSNSTMAQWCIIDTAGNEDRVLAPALRYYKKSGYITWFYRESTGNLLDYEKALLKNLIRDCLFEGLFDFSSQRDLSHSWCNYIKMYLPSLHEKFSKGMPAAFVTSIIRILSEEIYDEN